MHSALVEGFRSAGVPVELAWRPLVPMAPRIVQLDVHITEWKGERVRLWRGARENQVNVLDSDRGWGQLVLRLREPSRRFQHLVPRPAEELRARRLQEIAASGSRFVQEEGRDWRIESRTRDESRQFLVGYDEQHLFISEVSWGETIGEAHDALKPVAVRDAELRWPGCVTRQGEWFFVPARVQEQIALEKHRAIERDGAIESAARPHIAAERAEVGGSVFVRGVVSHPDHAPVLFTEWRRAVRNAAVIDQRWPGLHWID